MAATCLGCIVNTLPSTSNSQQADLAQSLSEVLAAFQAAGQNAPRLSQSNSARSGVPHGLAALLGAPHMLSGVAGGDTWLLTRTEYAGHAKQALEVC